MKLSFTHPFQLVFGLVIWIIWFVLMYASLSISCSIAPPDITRRWTWINLMLLFFTLVTASVLFYFAYRFWCAARTAATKPKVSHFVLKVGFGGYLTAAGATLAVGFMVLFFPPCL